MTETSSSRAQGRGDPEQTLRGWLEERVTDNEERARLLRFLDGLRAPSGEGPPDFLPEPIRASPGPADDTAVWELARALITKHAELRQELWRAIGERSGTIAERLIPVASHIEQAVDEVLASGLEQHLRAYDSRVREQAAMDSLTRLPGRAWLTSLLDEELARAQRYQRPFALLFIDMDGLKQINDTHGHEVGDRALAHLASRVRQTIRTSDLIGRYGGDEFLCFLAETTGEAAAPLAGRIVQNTNAAPPRPPGRVTISVGVAAYPESGRTIGDLLRVADLGLYHVKSRGGNAYALPLGNGAFTVRSPN